MKLFVKLQFIFFLFLGGCTNSPEFYSSLKEYPADGISGGKITLKRSLDDINTKEVNISGDLRSIRVISHRIVEDEEVVYFKSTTYPGKVVFKTNDNKKLNLTFYKISIDLDEDGFPEEVELSSEHDRNAFRNWFVRIAQSQFLKRNYSWNKRQRDCAGLIRYAYREALKKHDKKWQNESGIVIDKNLPDVKKYNFPHVPVLGRKIFKTRKGKSNDIKSFGYFADAKTIISLNTKFISRNIHDAKMGDIIFFRDDLNFKYPYHSMIVSEKNKEIVLIYHTGSDDTLKRVNINYLNKSKNFKPVIWNKNFLGIYRFLILE